MLKSSFQEEIIIKWQFKQELNLILSQLEQVSIEEIPLSDWFTANLPPFLTRKELEENLNNLENLFI